MIHAEAVFSVLIPLLMISALSILGARYTLNRLYPIQPLFKLGSSGPPFRFALADLFVLVVHVQVGLAVGLGLTVGAPLGVKIAMAGFFGILPAVWWWMTMTALARNGVARSEHRLWSLAVVSPIGYLIGLLLAVWFIGFLVLMAAAALILWSGDASLAGVSSFAGLWVLFGLIVAVLTAACQAVSRYLVREGGR